LRRGGTRAPFGSDQRVQGPWGSTLLAPTTDDAHLAAVARWRSKEDIEAFWADPGGSDFDGAELLSVEIFEEVDDLTLQDPVTDL
jgi:hypothetical protein